jgi:hypothetical protein
MEGFLWLLCFDTRDTEIVPSEETLILRSIGLICMLVFYSELNLNLGYVADYLMLRVCFYILKIFFLYENI